MKKVITFGVFDLFHIGHLNLFENIKRLIPDAYLIVAVQDTDFILKYKPNAKIWYSLDDRIKMIRALRCVDEVIVYNDVYETLKKVDFDVFAHGPDQSHASFQNAIKFCHENKKTVLEMPRTEHISSSAIKQEI